MTLPKVYWLTGLSGAGKSTIALPLHKALCERHGHACLLDGDIVRNGLCRDLGFDAASRTENIRRMAEVAKLFHLAGLPVVAALISPFRADRDMARRCLPEGVFMEIYVATPLSVCEQRDPKGLYKKARCGELHEFTGISSPYEAPEHPDLVLDTQKMDVASCVDAILACGRA